MFQQAPGVSGRSASSLPYLMSSDTTTNKTWRGLFLLPHAVLRAPYRAGGAKGRAKAEADTKQRARRWLEGARAELWDSRQRAAPQRKDGDEAEEHKRARAASLCSEGLYAKACAALLAAPPAEVTPDIL